MNKPAKLQVWGGATSRTLRPHWMLHELDIDYERFPVIVRYDGPGAEEGRKMMAEVPGAEMYGAETTIEEICKRIVERFHEAEAR